MKPSIDILRGLYGEAPMPERPAPDAPERLEHDALAATKRALDARPPAAPDPDVVAAVLAAAARASAPAEPRADRPAVRRARRRRSGLLATTLSILVVALVGVWQLRDAPEGGARLDAPVAEAAPDAAPEVPASDEAPRTFEAAPDPSATPPAGAATLADATPPRPTPPAPRGGAAASGREQSAPAPDRRGATGKAALTLAGVAADAAPAPPAGDSLLGWDDSDDVQRLRRRIELLQARSGGAWDEPVVPLEAPIVRPSPDDPNVRAARSGGQR